MPARFTRSLLLLLALSACEPTESDPSSDAGRADAGLGEVDAGAADAGLVMDDAGALDPLPAPWRREPSFPAAVDHHATVVIEAPDGPYLYVFGGLRVGPDGQPEEIYDAVWRARILGGGELGPWEPESPLPLPLAFHAIAIASRASGPYVVLSGGVTQEDGALSASPYFLGVGLGADGRLGDWGANADLTTATLHASAEIVGERMYLAGGGAGAAGANPTVLSLSLSEEDFATLRVEAPLPAPRTHHVMFSRGDELYVVAGFHEPPTAATVVNVATIGPDGVIDAWREAGMIDAPLWTAARLVTADGLLLVGGGDGAAPTDRVVRFRFAADGSLMPAEDVMRLPYARAHVHQTPQHDGRFYSVGGRFSSAGGMASSRDVYSAPIP